MSNLINYDDFFNRFHNDVNRLMGNPRRWDEDSDGSRVATSAWTPAVDIREDADRFVLLADLPGVEPKDIEITMEKGVLTIKGERVQDRSGGGNGYSRVERTYGTFYRRFSLPDTADGDNITAKGNNGVLEIVLPKKEQAQPRRIAVQ